MYYDEGNWYAVVVGDLGNHADIDQIEVADFGPYYIVSVMGIADDSSVTIRNYARDITVESGLSAVVALSTTLYPTFACCCNFNGQLIIGGLQTTVSPWTEVGLNGVAWGAIGKLALNPTTNPTAGFRALPWKSQGGYDTGITFKVMKLGSNVVAYGDGGKVLMVPAVVGNTSTFGFKHIPGLGVSSGNHVAGDEHLHGWIDLNGEFWTMAEGSGPEKRGYKSYIDTILAYTHATLDYRTVVSYVPLDQTFYISNGYSCLVINQYGAYTTHQLVTSIGMSNKRELLGFFMDSLDVEGRIVTHDLDFKLRGIKTIGLVEAGIHHELGTSNNAYATADFRYNKTSSYTRKSWTPMNPSGTSTIMAAGEEFRVGVKADNYVGMKLDYLNLKVKITDRRFMRGLAAYSVDQVTE
jgi:hypothetical protein